MDNYTTVFEITSDFVYNSRQYKKGGLLFNRSGSSEIGDLSSAIIVNPIPARIWADRIRPLYDWPIQAKRRWQFWK